MPSSYGLRGGLRCDAFKIPGGAPTTVALLVNRVGELIVSSDGAARIPDARSAMDHLLNASGVGRWAAFTDDELWDMSGSLRPESGGYDGPEYWPDGSCAERILDEINAEIESRKADQRAQLVKFGVLPS